MKYLRRSLAVGILTMFLAITALAGEMPCPIAAPVPPSAAGDMPFPSAASTGDMPYPLAASTDAVTEIALSLVQSALSLF